MLSKRDSRSLESRVGAVETKLNKTTETRLGGLETRMTKAETSITSVKETEAKMVKTLDDVLADVTDLGTREDGLVVIVNGLKSQVATLLAEGGVPPDVQAKVDAVFSAIEQRKTAVQAAIDANTEPVVNPEKG